jgi:hypothetical protein
MQHTDRMHCNMQTPTACLLTWLLAYVVACFRDYVLACLRDYVLAYVIMSLLAYVACLAAWLL